MKKKLFALALLSAISTSPVFAGSSKEVSLNGGNGEFYCTISSDKLLDIITVNISTHHVDLQGADADGDHRGQIHGLFSSKVNKVYFKYKDAKLVGASVTVEASGTLSKTQDIDCKIGKGAGREEYAPGADPH